METKNELDDLLKRAMQFNNGELPEPDPRIQKRLRKKLIRNSAIKHNRFLSGLITFLNIDIKLYHAGIGIAVAIMLFIFLRNGCGAPAETRQPVIVADTNVDLMHKNDSAFIKDSANIN